MMLSTLEVEEPIVAAVDGIAPTFGERIVLFVMRIVFAALIAVMVVATWGHR